MNEQIRNFEYLFDQPERLDKYLATQMEDFSRSRVQGFIRDGFVWVNQQQAVKTGVMVYQGDMISVHIPPALPTNLIPQDIPLDIVFENEDMLVINKSHGMVVHPSAGHDEDTLVHAVLAHVPNLEGVGGEKRPGIVHRLDKNTSGIILVAKNERSHRWLQDQFRTRAVEKTYFALVDGIPPTPNGRVEAPIGRDPVNRKQMAVMPPGKGREAVTEYFTVQSFQRHTLLRVNLLTGRTHQIRLHMAFLKCPVVGDTIYGYRHPSLPIERHFLHAARISIRLLGEEEPITFEAGLPRELTDLLEKLQ